MAAAYPLNYSHANCARINFIATDFRFEVRSTRIEASGIIVMRQMEVVKHAWIKQKSSAEKHWKKVLASFEYSIILLI